MNRVSITERYKEGVNFNQKHNYNMAKMMVFIEQYYMFRPILAIFRFSQLL